MSQQLSLLGEQPPTQPQPTIDFGDARDQQFLLATRSRLAELRDLADAGRVDVELVVELEGMLARVEGGEQGHHMRRLFRSLVGRVKRALEKATRGGTG